MSRLLVVVEPDSPRWRVFSAEAQAAGVEVEATSWEEAACRGGELGEPSGPAWLRLDAPSLRSPSHDAFVGDGAFDVQWRAPTGAWFEGFHATLEGLARWVEQSPHVTALTDPLDALAMCRKSTTRARLDAEGVSGPLGFMADPGAGAEAILREIAAREWQVAYVKLDTGAGGVGIVRVELRDGPRGLSSVLRQGDAIHNTRRLRQVEGPELRALLEALARRGAWVERGLDPLMLAGRYLDLRVVVVGGEAIATIPRLSQHPVTNITLGGRRGDPDAVRQAMGQRAWLDAQATARAAARCFDAFSVGVDLLVDPSGTPHVLEVNPFGDFFPGWTDAAGRSVYARWFGLLAPQLRSVNTSSSSRIRGRQLSDAFHEPGA